MTERTPMAQSSRLATTLAFCLVAAVASGGVHFDRLLQVRGDSDYPPYEFLDEAGNPAGFNVELFRAVTDAMQLETEVELGPWAKVRQEVEQGRADVLMGMFRSVERDRLVDFSMPHTIVSYCLFVPRSSTIQRLEDLGGRTVLVQRGDIMDDYAERAITAGQFVRLDTPLQVLLALSEGRGDAALLPRVQGLFLCTQHHLRGLRAAGPPLQPQEYCFAVTDGQTALRGLLNEGLAIVQSNGTYDRIRERWFGIHSASFWQRQEVHYVVYVLVGIIFLLVLLVARGSRLSRELRRQQRVLVETEARWSLALEGSALGVFDWDVAQDRLIYSPQYHRLLDYEPGALGGGISQWKERVHPDDLPTCQGKLEEHLRGETPYYESEYRMRGASGAYR